ncbi:MAG: thermonuclease family protein [Roseobacter sp.]
MYDGDTIWADIDLGFNIVLHSEPLRMHRIDTPEVKGEGKERGIEVRDLLAAKLADKEVYICTVQKKDGQEKKGTFHRYLAEVWVDGENINDWLLSEGYAEPEIM